MKRKNRPKNPNREEKIIISKSGLNPKKHGVIKKEPTNLKIINKKTGKIIDLRY